MNHSIQKRKILGVQTLSPQRRVALQRKAVSPIVAATFNPDIVMKKAILLVLAAGACVAAAAEPELKGTPSELGNRSFAPG